MASDYGPQHLSRALAELIARRGYARVGGDAQLQAVWGEVAGPLIARQTRAVAIRRGVLQVSVAHAPLLSELVAFHKESLLECLRNKHADLKIRDLKFKLDSNVGGSRSDPRPLAE